MVTLPPSVSNPLPALVDDARRRASRALQAALAVESLPSADEQRLSRLYVGLVDLQMRLSSAHQMQQIVNDPDLERAVYDLQARTWVAAALLEAMVSLHAIDPRDEAATERAHDWSNQIASLSRAYGRSLFA
jgi:hypothetical protein